VLDRAKRTAAWHGPVEAGDERLVHPYLGHVGAVFARWDGRHAFHARAFVVDDRAWALLGHNEAGKSSLLGALALAGTSVLCDDVLVVDDGRVLAGPRCVDLRAPAAARLEPGDRAEWQPERERYRVRLDSVAPAVALGGFLALDWGDAVDLRRLTGSDRLALLFRRFTLRLPRPTLAACSTSPRSRRGSFAGRGTGRRSTPCWRW
jgi:hypothetical protein